MHLVVEADAPLHLRLPVRGAAAGLGGGVFGPRLGGRYGGCEACGELGIRAAEAGGVGVDGDLLLGGGHCAQMLCIVCAGGASVWDMLEVLGSTSN